MAKPNGGWKKYITFTISIFSDFQLKVPAHMTLSRTVSKQFVNVAGLFRYFAAEA